MHAEDNVGGRYIYITYRGKRGKVHEYKKD